MYVTAGLPPCPFIWALGHTDQSHYARQDIVLRIIRHHVAVVVLVAAAVVQSACGGGDASSPGNNGGTTPTTPTPPATPQARSVALDVTSFSLVQGQTRQLNATVSADAGFTGSLGVNWTSSNPLVATVASGLVTAVAAGNTTITATSVANTTLSASAAVSVTAPPPPTGCSPLSVAIGATVQSSQTTCTTTDLGGGRLYTVPLSQSLAFSATLSPAQTLAVGLDLDHPVVVQPVAGTSSQVTYAVILPQASPRLAILGNGIYSMTIDTTTASMANAQNCVAVVAPGASATITLARACVTVDLYYAWTTGKQMTIRAQHPTITPSLQVLVNGALLGQGTSDQTTHTTTLQLLPATGQFVRVSLTGANPNQTNQVSVTITQ